MAGQLETEFECETSLVTRVIFSVYLVQVLEPCHAITDLEPRIHAILSAPGTDLSTISAKRVRRLLLEQEDIPQELVKDNKQAIDGLISNVFARVSEEKGFQQDEEGADAEGGRRTTSAEPAAAAVTPKKRHRASLDGHGDHSSAKSAKPSTAGMRHWRENFRNRSMAVAGVLAPVQLQVHPPCVAAVGVVAGGYVDAGEAAKPTKKRGSGGLSKEYILSEPLAALVQEDSLSRPQVVKKLWAYIKGNSLQNPTNGREIMCDGALRAVFNTDKIDMFKMNKELGKHLSEPSETTV
ncbi:hypothetical protein BJV77DRAFT_1063487 [Russula vinacea]|nr:hypothetical protein BJV77DRAFT_1063487 [Russula vinacea]